MRSWRIAPHRPTLSVRLRVLLVATFVAAFVGAGRLSAQVVSGRIYDSVAKAPLARATVQLIPASTGSAPAEATSDSLGKFAFSNVTPGAYTLGFYHAVLDSLGIDPPFVRLQVAGQPVHADLAVPGPTQILTAICGQRPPKDSGGVVIGHLYDAATRLPVRAGQVSAEWYSVKLIDGKLAAANPRGTATTTSAGWFAICGVPRDDDVVVEGARGGDTTGVLQVHVPSNGIAEQALFVDRTETVSVAARDSAGAPDATRPPQIVHRGSARASGIVTDGATGRPLAGAQVTVAGAALTEPTDAQGKFNITHAPGGTQILQIRAVGYLPERRTIELFGDATTTLDIRLTNLRVVLDTMRVTASRVYLRDANGFERRRHRGAGATFFDSADVARANVFATSRMLERVNGVRLSGTGATAHVFMMNANLYCEPTIFIDGVSLPDFTAGDLDAAVSTEEIIGMEVYTSAAMAPVQYKGVSSDARNGRGCGSILVWTTRSR